MKSSLKNLRRKSFIFLSILSSVVLVFCFVCFGVRSSASAVIGANFSDSLVGYAVETKSYPGSSWYAGKDVTIRMGQYGFDVPFDWTYLTADAFNTYISVGYGGTTVGVNGLSSMQDFYYLYTGDYEHDMVCMVDLPDEWRGTVINGNLYFAFSSVAGGGEAQFYQSDGVGWEPTSQDVVVDFSQRVDVSLGDCSGFPDSLSAYLYPNHNNVDNMYQVQLNFENYYVPYYSPTTSSRVIIPLKFHYTFTTALASDSFSSYGSSTQPFSCVLYQFRPTFPPYEFAFGFEPAKFILDNEYYTIAQALANNTALSNVYLNSIDIENYLHDVKTLLSNWLNVGQVDYIDFPDFSQALLTALGSLVSNTSNDYSSQLATIIGQLANIYANQQAIAYDVSTTESYCYDIAQYMQFLYSFVAGRHNMDNPGSGAIEANNMYYLLYSLAVGLTGDYQFSVSGQRDPDMAQLTYDRWVDIIRDAIGDSLTDASLRLDVAKVSSEETAYHDIEVSVWDDIFEVLDSHPGYLTFWEAYMDAPSAIQGAGVWYVGQIEDLWERIGWITYIISTILIAGVLVLFLGKINQFK